MGRQRQCASSWTPTFHAKLLAYRANRGHLRAQRGAAPIWSESHLATSASPWLNRGQPLRQRVHSVRTLWDLRWHGENKAIATHSQDPQVSACPICHRFWSQAHVLCDCPGTTGARSGGTLDLTISINRLPPGPMLVLRLKFHSLLIIHNHATLMARRWAGPWDQAAIIALRPEIASCTRKQFQSGHIGRVMSTTITACWRVFMALARELSPPHLRPLSTTAISRRPNVHHRMGPSPGRGPRINTEIPTPCFVRILIELAI